MADNLALVYCTQCDVEEEEEPMDVNDIFEKVIIGVLIVWAINTIS